MKAFLTKKISELEKAVGIDKRYIAFVSTNDKTFENTVEMVNGKEVYYRNGKKLSNKEVKELREAYDNFISIYVNYV